MTYTPAPVPFYGPTFTNPIGTYPNSMNTPQIAYPNSQPAMNLIPGRIIGKEDDINPTEVRMDGSVSIFPVSDGSKIFMKTRDDNMNINTTIYVPQPKTEESKAQTETPSITMEDLFNAINDVNDNIKVLTNKQNAHRNKSNKQNNQNRNSNPNEGEENA